MEDMTDVLVLGLLFVFITSLVAFIRPLPKLWAFIQKRKGIVALGSFILMVVVVNLLSDSEERRASRESSCQADISCWGRWHLADATAECTSSLSLSMPYMDGGPWEHVQNREVQMQILRAQGEMLLSEWSWLEDSSRGIISYWGNQYRLKDGRGIINTPRFNCRYILKEKRARLSLD